MPVSFSNLASLNKSHDFSETVYHYTSIGVSKDLPEIKKEQKLEIMLENLLCSKNTFKIDHFSSFCVTKATVINSSQV